MEASTIQAGRGLGRARVALGSPILRLRSDAQLVALFRAGNDDAFRVIHDRYRPRLLAYVRQMLAGHSSDVDDALQDVFVRAYGSLRVGDGELLLRPWLYRVAHNRCIDELRRCAATPVAQAFVGSFAEDPVAESEQRESLRRLVIDIGRLPEQQRSALLMRELSGMSYAETATALGVSVPAVKSLLIRARIGLTQAADARSAACTEIRRELADSHDRGVRPSWLARRHLRDCASCRECRAEMRSVGRQLAALAPALGPLALLPKLLGVGGGAGGGAAGTGGTAAAGAGGAATGLASVSAAHVATLVVTVVAAAGGAVELQHAVATAPARHAHHRGHHPPLAAPNGAPAPTSTTAAAPPPSTPSQAQSATASGQPATGGASPQAGPIAGTQAQPATAGTGGSRASAVTPTQTTPTATSPPTTVGTVACLLKPTTQGCPNGTSPPPTTTTTTTTTTPAPTDTTPTPTTPTTTTPAPPTHRPRRPRWSKSQML